MILKIKGFLLSILGFKKKKTVMVKNIKEYWYPNSDEMQEMILSGRIQNTIYPLRLNEISEVEGGVWLQDLLNNSSITIETRCTNFILKKINDNRYLISGHEKVCPVPIEVVINGSTWGQFTHSLKMKFIGRGMHMEFIHPEFGVISTSEILDIRELKP